MQFRYEKKLSHLVKWQINLRNLIDLNFFMEGNLVLLGVSCDSLLKTSSFLKKEKIKLIKNT